MERIGTPDDKGSLDFEDKSLTERTDGGSFLLAVLLARRRRFAEAVEFLQKALDRRECSEFDALDLQARILAQQGRYLEAETCWLRAKAKKPHTARTEAALQRIYSERAFPVRLSTAGVILACLISGILLLVQIIANISTVADVAESQRAAVAALKGEFAAISGELQGGQKALEVRLTSLGSSMNAVTMNYWRDREIWLSETQAEQTRQVILDSVAASLRVVREELTRIGITLSGIRVPPADSDDVPPSEQTLSKPKSIGIDD